MFESKGDIRNHSLRPLLLKSINLRRARGGLGGGDGDGGVTGSVVSDPSVGGASGRLSGLGGSGGGARSSRCGEVVMGLSMSALVLR